MCLRAHCLDGGGFRVSAPSARKQHGDAPPPKKPEKAEPMSSIETPHAGIKNLMIAGSLSASKRTVAASPSSDTPR
jgi:hypothetical protein